MRHLQKEKSGKIMNEEVYEKLKLLFEKTPTFDVQVRTKCAPVQVTIQSRKEIYYIPIRIPKFIAKCFGDKVITEYIDCIVNNIEEL